MLAWPLAVLAILCIIASYRLGYQHARRKGQRRLRTEVEASERRLRALTLNYDTRLALTDEYARKLLRDNIRREGLMEDYRSIIHQLHHQIHHPLHGPGDLTGRTLTPAPLELSHAG